MRRLVPLRSFGDDLARHVWRETGVQKPLRDFVVLRARHIDYNSCFGSKRESSEGAGVGGTGKRGEDDVGSDTAVGKGDFRGGGGAERSRNTWHDFEIDGGFAESLDFLGGAAEEHRVATFETDDNFVRSSGGDEERVDVALRQQTEASALADINELGVRQCEIEDLRADERIVKNDVGRSQKAQGFDGQEFGITRTGAD
jgi:hypothetical protein